MKEQIKEKLDNVLGDDSTSVAVKTVLVIVLAIMALILTVVAISFSGWIIMLLWNWAAVGAFGMTAITYFQGVAIAIALSILKSIFQK